MKLQRDLKRLLFYISTIRGGGAARVLVNLANEFSARGYEVYLVTNFREKNEYVLAENVNRLSLEDTESKSGTVKKNVVRIMRLRKIVRDIQPDSITSLMDENNIRLIAATLFLKRRVLISVRNDPKAKYTTSMMRMLVRTLYRLPDCIVFQTESAKNWFPEAIQKKSLIVMNQVDPVFYKTKKTSEKYYIAVGRLARQKNYFLLIDAFAEMLSCHQKLFLRIYGVGELESELQAYIDLKACGQSIRLMGTTTHIDEAFAQAKCYILTSDYEGMPNTLLEAMAVGLPVISTDCPCGGPAAVIEDGKSGLLFPVGDKDALVKLLERIEHNAEFRNYLSEQAKLRAQMFTPEIVYREWEKVINGI